MHHLYCRGELVIAHFTRTFSAAHRIADDPSPCHRIHGHNFVVKVAVETNGERDMVIPHQVVKGIIDLFDHILILEYGDPLIQYLNESPEVQFGDTWVHTTSKPPTTENLAQVLADEIANEALNYQQDVPNDMLTYARATVLLTETASISAEVSSIRTRVYR